MEIFSKPLLWLCLGLGLTSNIQCESLQGKNLTVTTKLTVPYMLATGANRYEGYIVDLLDAISKILKFEYVLKITDDNGYGSLNLATGKWNGMIADLVYGGADIAAGDLVITSQREKVVDFTYPFMKLGIGMLHKRDSSGLETFRNVEQVASESEVTYGAVNGGAVQYFFNHSRNPICNKIWKSMQAAVPTPFVNSNTDGIERVMQGGYVFFTESPAIEYITERRCELYQVCGLLDSKGYGLAVQHGSSIRQELNLAILELEENGILAELKNKWWKEKQPEKTFCPW